MNKRVIKLGASTLMLAAVTLWSQDQAGAGKQALQQRLAELKQSIAANQGKLRTYTWTETTDVSLKGETKKREQKQCLYGPDGKVQKSPIGDSSGGAKKPQQRGLKGKIVEKKVDELKDYMERVGSLVSRYVPPHPQRMQASFQAGKANLNPAGGGIASLVFQDYAKAGDKALAFNTAGKKLQSYTVDTYLDSPQDLVSLKAEFSSLPDSTNYVAHTLLNATGKQILVNRTNSNYRPVGQ